jgi:hypothetical protein
MSEPPVEPPRERQAHEEPHLPRWVPALIGAVLVIIAAFAVYTGLRYRNPTLADGIIRPKRTPATATMGGGPPGEPGPGASLVFPGESGDNAPTASEAVTGRARATISGGGTGGVTAAVRLWARRGMNTNVVPDDAMIYINDLPIGEAKQFNAPDEVYDFPAPGSYTVRVIAPGYKERVFVVTAAENAQDEVARIDVKLAR